MSLNGVVGLEEAVEDGPCFERTAIGFRVRFPACESELQNHIYRGLFNVFSDAWAFFDVKRWTSGTIGKAKTALMLFQISGGFVNEMVKASEQEAFFAASIVACSLLESVLMVSCLREQDRVTQTKAWKKFAHRQKKHGQLFKDIIFWIDLGVLISVGKELEWFSNAAEMTEALKHADELHEFPELELSPLQILDKVQSLRNRLHPGKCMREKVRVTERDGKLSLAIAYVSLFSLVHKQSGDLSITEVSYEIPAPLRKLLLTEETGT